MSPTMRNRRAAMQACGAILLLAASGCNPARVQTVDRYAGPPLGPPDRILVANFAVSPAQVKLDPGIRAELTRIVDGGSTGNERLQAAARTNDALVEALVSKLRSYGLNVERSYYADTPQSGRTVLIQGQLTQIDEGNRTRRTWIGLGAGKSQVSADAQLLYESGRERPRLVEAFTATDDSGRAPGAAETMGAGAAAGRLAASAATTAGLHAVSERRRAEDTDDARRLGEGLAEQIGRFFVQQGWLSPSAVR